MSINSLPTRALTVRQPWAHAIVFLGKPVENRSKRAVHNLGPEPLGRVAVHAGQGMTRDEYESARGFMEDIGVECPPPAELARGGIIGSVEVVAIITALDGRARDDPWFCGPMGLVLRDPQPCAFIPAIGALGYFPWVPAHGLSVPPAKWMRAWGRSGPETRVPGPKPGAVQVPNQQLARQLAMIFE